MNKNIGINLGTCKISATRTKYFFQKGKSQLEFYIDYDPATGLSCLWIRPGYTEAFPELIMALFKNVKQAEAAELGLEKDLTSKQ